jgi:hypothetical protein
MSNRRLYKLHVPYRYQASLLVFLLFFSNEAGEGFGVLFDSLRRFFRDPSSYLGFKVTQGTRSHASRMELAMAVGTCSFPRGFANRTLNHGLKFREMLRHVLQFLGHLPYQPYIGKTLRLGIS